MTVWQKFRTVAKSTQSADGKRCGPGLAAVGVCKAANYLQVARNPRCSLDPTASAPQQPFACCQHFPATQRIDDGLVSFRNHAKQISVSVSTHRLPLVHTQDGAIITWSHFRLLSLRMRVNAALRSSSSNSNNRCVTSVWARACTIPRAHDTLAMTPSCIHLRLRGCSALRR
jgi:hypothetical protein